MANKKDQVKGKPKTRILPRPDRAQNFAKAAAATKKQYAGTLAKLAK